MSRDPWRAASRLQRAGSVVVYATWFALMAGAGRAIYYVLGRLLTDALLWSGDQVVWSAPIAHVIVFAVPAAPIAVAAALMPRMVSERVVVAFFATFAIFALLLLFPRIHHLASFALSLGLAVRVSGWVVADPVRRRPLVRWSAAAIVAATAIAAVVVPWRDASHERRTLAALPPAADGAPNILLIILDTVRAASMHLYGSPRDNTTHIEALAAEGTTFDRAIATAPWTLPTHMTLLTGRYPGQFQADWLEPADDSTPLLSEVLARHGYASAGFVANLNYTTSEIGLARGAARWREYRRSFGELLLSSQLLQTDMVRDLRNAALQRDLVGMVAAVLRFNWSSSDRLLAHHRKRAGMVVDEFLEWEQARGRRPWFALLNFFDAHAAYKPQPPFDTMFTAAGPAAAYEGAIATIDRDLGRLFETLRARGTYDRTIIVVTSDHGELFGEHGMWEHGDHLYLPLIHVPLVIRAPQGVPAGTRVPQTVSLVDLPATLLDLADIAPESTPIGGVSLRGVWTGADVDRRSPAAAMVTHNVPPSERLPNALRYASLVDDSLQLILGGNGAMLLYDLHADPEQARDLSTTDRGAAAAHQMRERLLPLLGRWRVAPAPQ